MKPWILAAVLALTLPAAAPLALAADAAAPSGLQALAGDWDASLTVGAQTLPLSFHIRPSASPPVTLDSPAQGAREQPVTLSQDATSITIAVGNGAVFKLTLAGDTLTGVLNQGGGALPVTFKRRAGVVSAAPTAGETAVQVAGPIGPLKGTLTLTEGPAKAAAVFIEGSGPTNRDGDSALGAQPETIRLLADALAAQGIEGVRYDKRGMFASQGAVVDANAVTLQDYADDARAFAALAAQRAGTPCAWLIGHSEGALVALQVAQQPDKICGLVLLSAPGLKLGQNLDAQLKGQVGPSPTPQVAAQLAEMEGVLTKLEAGRHVDVSNMSDSAKTLFAPQVQGLLIDEFQHDPAALLAAYPGPVLVLHGTNDLQVLTADADRLAAARPGVKRVELPGVGHGLKTSPTDRAGTQAVNDAPGIPLAPGVAEAVASFILGPR